MDIRSIRLPGVISHQVCQVGQPTMQWKCYGGQTKKVYTSYLEADTTLDMVYIDDAIRGILRLMQTDRRCLRVGWFTILQPCNFR